MWKNPINLKCCACLLDLRDRFEKIVKFLWYANVAFDGKLRQMCEHCICKHSTCFNNFKEAKSNNVAICFAFTNVLRVETKVAEWSKASRYPQWCWTRYFWSPAMLYQRCWCKCSVAVVYRAGQPSRIVLPDSLWQPLNSFIAFNCSWFFDQLLQSVFCFALPLPLTGCFLLFRAKNLIN